MHLFRRLLSLSRTSLAHFKLLQKPLNYSHKHQIFKLPLLNLEQIRPRCTDITDFDEDEDENEEEFDLENTQDVIQTCLYSELTNEFLGVVSGGHNVIVIQPYIKWGRDKIKHTTPELQMQEAVALVRTLPYWTIDRTMYAPLLSMRKTYILGSGSLKSLKEYIQSNGNVTAVFFSMNSIKYHQARELKAELGVEIFDRYSLIIHIFRAHAKSPEAKLQVALAELPYIRRKVNTISQGNISLIGMMEHKQKVLEIREVKLKKRLERLRFHRLSNRKVRRANEIPTIAVVGYTNAGKTSLIKALTGSKNLQPRNQLFATLDTTTHAGHLPCYMKVLFVDTIGFIQDAPDMLIEPFRATLEDALISDIVVHIYDASHPDRSAQVQHVENTLDYLYRDKPRPIIINVANKCDLLLNKEEKVPEDHLPIVATDSVGIDLLRYRIQDEILNSTGRKIVKIRVKAGSPVESWVYKQMTILHATACETNSQYSLLNVVTTDVEMHHFRGFLKEVRHICS